MKLSAKLPAIALLSLLQTLTVQAAVFGVDNRQIITPGTSSGSSMDPVIEQMARSTAILLLTSERTIDPKTSLITLDAPPIDDACSGEPFLHQPSVDYACTGFLVAPDLLVTAGHCVYAVNTPNQERINDTKDGCETFNWLFDYQAGAGAPALTKNIPHDHLFQCKQIIYATQTEKSPYLDYALIQLDRPAVGRPIFKLNAAPLAMREAVAMIGYPHGTPAEYVDSAVVTLNNPARDSFLTSLDAFDGNSGSPVFNSQHEVVGILISGTPSHDLVKDPIENCQRSNHCNESGTSCDLPDTADFISKLIGYQGVGSEVQRITPIVEMLKHLAAGQPAH